MRHRAILLRLLLSSSLAIPAVCGASEIGHRVYVTNEMSGDMTVIDHQVSVIDTAANRVIKQFQVGQRPRQAAFSPDGRRAYVTGETDGTVSVVDTSTHSVIETVRLVGELVRPMEVDVSPDGRWAYVTTGRARTLVAIDTSTNEPMRTVTVGDRPWGLASAPMADTSIQRMVPRTTSRSSTQPHSSSSRPCRRERARGA